MSIPVVLAAQDSPAPGTHGALGVVLSPVLGDHDKVLARGPRGLGERKETAAVPSRACWGGTTKGGQEMNICTPRRVFQLLSCRDQTLLAVGFPRHTGRGSHPAAIAGHPHTGIATRTPGAGAGRPAHAAALCWPRGDTPGLAGGVEPDAGASQSPACPTPPPAWGPSRSPVHVPWLLSNHGSAPACPAPCSLWALPTS